MFFSNNKVCRLFGNCIYRPLRAHCTGFSASLLLVQCTLSGKQSNPLICLIMKVISQKLCQWGIYAARAMPLTQILRYETHIIVVLCSAERIYSLTVQYALIHRYLQILYFYQINKIIKSRTIFQIIQSLAVPSTFKTLK